MHIQYDELDYIIKNIDKFYGLIEKPKIMKDGSLKRNKDGSPRPRVLNPSKGKLKVIQERLNKYLQRKISFPDYVYGAVKRKDNVLNASRHKGKKFIFQSDLQDFFQFVKNKDVYDTLVRYDIPPDFARIITRCTTYKGHLPQGAPTSSTLANLVFCSKAGDKINSLARENNWTFTTFIDDVTISSNKDFKDKIDDILDLIEEGGFKINQNKTHYKTSPATITGVVVKNNTLNITDEFYKKLKDTSKKSEPQILGEQNYLNKVLSYNKPPK